MAKHYGPVERMRLCNAEAQRSGSHVTEASRLRPKNRILWANINRRWQTESLNDLQTLIPLQLENQFYFRRKKCVYDVSFCFMNGTKLFHSTIFVCVIIIHAISILVSSIGFKDMGHLRVWVRVDTNGHWIYLCLIPCQEISEPMVHWVQEFHVHSCSKSFRLQTCDPSFGCLCSLISP